MDREYFDAKFEGMEKLMTAQEKNLTSYIGAVSANVKRMETELDEHKESPNAHGLGSSGKTASIIASWMGLLVAAAVGVFEFFKRNENR